MRYMKTCCGTFCSVKVGSQVLSILNFLIHAATLIVVGVFFDDIMEEAKRQDQQEASDFSARNFTGGKEESTFQGIIDERAAKLLSAIAITVAVFAAIGAIISGLFAYGAFKCKRNFLLPHLIFNAAHMLLVLVLGTVAIVGHVNKISLQVVASASVSFAVSFCIQLYFYVVVLSFYKNIEYAERHPQPSIACTAAPDGDQDGYPLPTHQPEFCPILPEKNGAV